MACPGLSIQSTSLIHSRRSSDRGRAGTVSRRASRPARIVLLASEGLPNEKIAAWLRIHRVTVWKWRERFRSVEFATFNEHNILLPNSLGCLKLFGAEITERPQVDLPTFSGDHILLTNARVIAFLVEAGLLPLDRARMLRGWVHSGFQVHRSRRIAAHECQDIERLAQYIVRNPFSIAKMQVNRSGDSILYRSGMNAKIKRNFLIHGSIHASIHDVRFHGAKYSSPLRSTFRTSAFRWCVTTAGTPTIFAGSAGGVQRRHRRRPRASPRQQQSRGVVRSQARRLKSSSIVNAGR